MQIGMVMTSFDELQIDEAFSSPKILLIRRSYKTVGVFWPPSGIASLLKFIFIIAYNFGKLTAQYHHAFFGRSI